MFDDTTQNISISTKLSLYLYRNNIEMIIIEGPQNKFLSGISKKNTLFCLEGQALLYLISCRSYILISSFVSVKVNLLSIKSWLQIVENACLIIMSLYILVISPWFVLSASLTVMHFIFICNFLIICLISLHQQWGILAFHKNSVSRWPSNIILWPSFSAA